jgi:FkbM family methyltransferase
MFYKLLNAYTRQFAFPRRGLKYFLKAAKWLGLADKTYCKKLGGHFYIGVNPSEHIQQQLFWYGCYEKELGEIIKRALRPGDVFFDIGANIGYFSLLGAIFQPASTVIAFEPVSSVFRKLEDNISINKITNIMAVNAAVGNKNEEGEIFISSDDNTGMSSLKNPENYSGKREKVKIIAIDDWFRSSGLPKIDLIKLDIEGSELAALRGMREILQNYKPLVIAEINPEILVRFDQVPADIFDYLNAFNFTGFLILKTGGLTRVDKYQTNETNNVLFAHNEKLGLYTHLFKV